MTYTYLSSAYFVAFPQVVTEIASPDMAGSEIDLGLAPGGRVKLLRSSAITLDNPNKSVPVFSHSLSLFLQPVCVKSLFV